MVPYFRHKCRYESEDSSLYAEQDASLNNVKSQMTKDFLFGASYREKVLWAVTKAFVFSIFVLDEYKNVFFLFEKW